MKLYELWNESLDSTPLETTQITPTTYEIGLNGQRIHIMTNQRNVNGFVCGSVMFINPDNPDNSMDVLNAFNTTQTFQVFSTIIKIVESMKVDVLFLIPRDSSIEIENKKGNLYKAIFTKMKMRGRLSSFGEIQNPETGVNVMYACQTAKGSHANIEGLLLAYGIDKGF